MEALNNMKIKGKFLFLLTLTFLIISLTKAVHTLVASPLSQDRDIFTVEVEDLHVNIEETFPTVTNFKLDETYKKEVKIKNTTNGAMFVRVMILPTLETLEGKVFSPRIGKEVQLTGMDAKWVDGEDGYYYYTDVIETNKKSGFLMKEIMVTDHTLSKGKEAFGIQLKVESINTVKNNFVEAWWQKEVPTASDEPYYTIYTNLDSLTLP